VKQIDRGILLERTSFSESSLILTFYMQNSGIQKFIFQGAKKKKQSLFPFTIYELSYYYRADSNLKKLTQADGYLSFDNTLMNPQKSIIAFFIADILRQTLKTNVSEKPIFAFLHQTIEQLNATDKIAWFPLSFLANFTTCLGIQPNTSHNDPAYFDVVEGEFYSDYSILHPNQYSLEQGVLVDYLFLLFKNKPVDYLSVTLTNRQKLLDILLAYYTQHVPGFRVGKSLEVIREVIRES